MNKKEKVNPPAVTDTLSEIFRTTVEFFALKAFSPVIKARMPPGHGEPVLVLPGLGGGDLTTLPLRNALRDLGYRTYAWKDGINTGPGLKTLRHIEKRLYEVFKKNGRQKVSLIGHSLGGIYARELAKKYPHMVKAVITLGSPAGAAEHPDSSMPMLRQVFELVNKRKNSVLGDAAVMRQMIKPPPVPTTAIYTRNDGIVNWRTCINPKGRQAENVEVLASHCGLVMNPLSLVVIADRLAQPEGAWKPFDAKPYGFLFRSRQAHEDYRISIPRSDRADSGIPGLFG